MTEQLSEPVSAGREERRMRETLVFKPGTRHGSVVSEGPCAEVHRNNKSGHADLKYYGGYLVAESVPPEFVPLLAAAPYLLEALKELVEQYIADKVSLGLRREGPEGTPLVQQARAAIAKAEGRA